MSQRLKNQVAIVTGAGSIGPGESNGSAIAKRFAKEGAKVICVGRGSSAEQTAATINKSGGRASFCQADVTKPEDVDKLIAFSLDQYGCVDVLVNNVGGSGGTGGPVDTTIDQWHQTVDINLTSQFLTCKAVLPSMIQRKSGCIINISSISAIHYASSSVAYSAAKAAVNQLTQFIGIQYAGEGIRANAIILGIVHTPHLEKWAKRQNAENPQQVINELMKKTPSGTLGTPADTAYAALFLASKESKFINGTSLLVDGGFTSYFDMKCDRH